MRRQTPLGTIAAFGAALALVAALLAAGTLLLTPDTVSASGGPAGPLPVAGAVLLAETGSSTLVPVLVATGLVLLGAVLLAFLRSHGGGDDDDIDADGP